MDQLLGSAAIAAGLWGMTARLELDSLRSLLTGTACAIEPDWLQKLGLAPSADPDL